MEKSTAWTLDQMDQEAQNAVRYAMAVENILVEPGGSINLQTDQDHNVERFYIENRWEKQWSNLHHIVDIEDNGSQQSSLKIVQMSMDVDDLRSITLERNEVDALLHILLKWRLKHLYPGPERKDEGDPFLGDAL